MPPYSKSSFHTLRELYHNSKIVDLSHSQLEMQAQTSTGPWLSRKTPTTVVLATDTQPSIEPNLHQGDIFIRPTKANLPIISEFKTNPTHAAHTAQDIPRGASRHLPLDNFIMGDRSYSIHLGLGDDNTSTMSNPQQILETSYTVSEFLKASREDPWTSQFLRFQNQQCQGTTTEEQGTYSFLRFLNGDKDDPWTPECARTITPQAVMRDLDEVDRLFGLRPGAIFDDK